MWVGVLNGNNGDDCLKELCLKFSDVIGYTEDEDRFFIKNPKFDDLQNDEKEIYELAKEDLSWIKGMAELYNICQKGVEVRQIAKLENGKFHYLVNYSEVSMEFRISEGSGSQIPIDSALIRCPEADEKVKEALIYFEREHSWVNLFKVYEIIDYDVGNATEMEQRGWVRRTDIDLFRCTAHNVRGAGRDARHALKEKINIPCSEILSTQEPMEIDRAIELIGKLLRKWLESKC